MELPQHIFSYLKDWTTDVTVAFALLGSYARGDAGPFSDVDVVRFVQNDDHDTDDHSFLLDDIDRDCNGQSQCPTVTPHWRSGSSNRRAGSDFRTLVVLSTATPSQVESWFTEPSQVVNVIAGLRDGRALWDPDGVFAGIQQRARQFQWTQEHQEKANHLAGKELIGWIEEVHKGLEGLRRNDTGRLLNARFGLSWGLARVMRVQRGVLSNSDNASFEDLICAVGPESACSQLLRCVFGLTGDGQSVRLSLREEVQAGLLLYCETFALLDEAIPQEARPLIAATVRGIRAELKEYQDSSSHIQYG